MKKLILKTLFFTVPFFIFYFISVTFTIFNEGDLIRLGYFFDDALPKSEIDLQYSMPIKYTSISDIDLNNRQIPQF